jgi:hypothetical protein
MFRNSRAICITGEQTTTGKNRVPKPTAHTKE